MAEFLLEIFSEEIPARMQLSVRDDLKTIMENDLQAQSLSFSSIRSYVTPRRLVGVVEGLAETTKSTIEERRGPKVGAANVAIQGFLKSAGVSLDACEQREGYYYAHLQTKSRNTRDILPEIVQNIFRKMTWPKSMAWPLENGKRSQLWVRPVRSVLTVFDGQAVSFELPTLGLTTSNITYGHRFLAPAAIQVSSFDEYHTKLERGFVIIDHQVRQTQIWQGLKALVHQKNLELQTDESLLQEIAGLVEYPVPLLGQIDAQFMDLPPAVLSTAMRVHQKYFTVRTKEGRIAPYFGVIANIKGKDNNLQMLAGYERVLRARLSDAMFFYAVDVKTSLPMLSRRLETIIFQEKLGTLTQKVTRLKVLMLAQGTGKVGERAAELAKSDLLTTMVGEFPELQGVMGEIYARAEGEVSEVAAAIREHYQPQGPNDQCPSAPLSVALALADKMDTLVGFFAIGEEPTGSKDPYALRRAALGIIRLVRENNLADFSLEPLCHEAVNTYKAQGVAFVKHFQSEYVLNFINDRLKIALRAEGIRHDCVTAVLEGSKTTADAYKPWSIARRAKALQDFLETADGQALLAAFRRAYGILKDEQKKDGISYPGTQVNVQLFTGMQESNLYNHLQKILAERDPLLQAHHYTDLMAQLATLRPLVDAFFDLKVNDEDPMLRQNRLELLGMLIAQMALIADLSHVEG